MKKPPYARLAEALPPLSGETHCIVFGNEKGGSGKSTTAMHVVVALLKRGFSVAVIDLDARQGTLTRMIDNRAAFVEESGIALPMPSTFRLSASKDRDREAAEEQDIQALAALIAEIDGTDFLVIDTPGTDSFISRLGHSHADTLITPLNDSFVDLDLLAKVDPSGRKIIGPSIYSQMVWEQRQQRAMARKPPIDWIVMRNRLSQLDARNKRNMERLLDDLAKRIRFRLAPGFSERVIFRELFPKGLTLLDVMDDRSTVQVRMSHLAARQEVRALLQAIGLPEPEDEAEPAEEAEESVAPEQEEEPPISGLRAALQRMAGG